MNPKIYNICVAVLAIGIAGLPATAQISCPPESEQDDEIAQRGIVHVRPDSTLEAFLTDIAVLHPEVTVTTLDQIPGRAIYLLGFKIPPGGESEFEIDLNDDFMSTLISGEFLYEAEAPEGKTGSTWVDGLAENDYDQQFVRELIGTPVAHKSSTGPGTVVAILDTGVDAKHPALAGRILPFGYDFIDNDDDPSDVGDGINNDPDEDDDIDEMTGHGTFVTGLLLMVAPDTMILPIRVLDSDGGGDGWALTQGLYYAIDHGVEVINMSISSTYETSTINQATLEAAVRGIVVVAAAGNFDCEEVRERPAMDDLDVGDGGTFPAIPENLWGAFGVVATDANDMKAPFSNYDERIVISAPGAADPSDPTRSIISTLPGGRFGAWEGTSFATPVVSGTIALLRAQYPQYESGDWDGWVAGGPAPDFFIYHEMQRLICQHAFNHYPFNDPMYAEKLGSGRLDTAASLSEGGVAPVLGDLNADGVVSFADILRILAEWGRVHTSADINGDGVVGIADLLVVLASWG